MSKTYPELQRSSESKVHLTSKLFDCSTITREWPEVRREKQKGTGGS